MTPDYASSCLYYYGPQESIQIREIERDKRDQPNNIIYDQILLNLIQIFGWILVVIVIVVGVDFF